MEDIGKFEKLDVKDRKLLYELDLNARLGTLQLGKRVGLRQEGVHYRLKRLEKRGIVSGYNILLNFGKIGYTGYGVYARFQNVSAEQRKRIVEELKKNEHIYWIAEFGGKYDLAFAIMAKNIVQFNELFSKVVSKHTKYLKGFSVAIRAELVQFPRAYLIEGEKKESKTPRFGKFIESEELHDFDRSILKEISDNARLSVLEISNRTGHSPQTISSRLKKLEERDIIQGYTTLIHCQEFGYESYQLFVNVHNLTKEKKEALLSYCNSHENIIFYIETVGKWNFEIVYEIEDQKKLQDLIIDFRTRFSDIILDVESIVLFDHYVKYNQWPLGF